MHPVPPPCRPHLHPSCCPFPSPGSFPAVDCLAVTAQSMRSMGAAAEAFSAALAQIYPGSKVAACSLGRLPAGGGSSGGGGS